MGIFRRISDIFRSNVNDLVDRAEDPEKMVKQIIIDMDRELTKSKQAYGQAKSAEAVAKKKYDDSARRSADWEAKAKAALAAGNVELAKKALAQKVKTDEEVTTYKEMWETLSTQSEAIHTQVETLQGKLEDAKSRQAMLIARSQMADTKKRLAQNIGTNLEETTSMEKFARMEEKILRKEAEADAFAELSGSNVTRDYETFEKLQANAKVDNELERLMAELGQTLPSEPSLEEQIAAAEAAQKADSQASEEVATA